MERLLAAEDIMRCQDKKSSWAMALGSSSRKDFLVATRLWMEGGCSRIFCEFLLGDQKSLKPFFLLFPKAEE